MRVAVLRMVWVAPRRFPFLFGGTFIEGLSVHHLLRGEQLNFPSFSEGLSLRETAIRFSGGVLEISLPFRRDFH